MVVAKAEVGKMWEYWLKDTRFHLYKMIKFGDLMYSMMTSS